MHSIAQTQHIQSHKRTTENSIWTQSKRDDHSRLNKKIKGVTVRMCGRPTCEVKRSNNVKTHVTLQIFKFYFVFILYFVRVSNILLPMKFIRVNSTEKEKQQQHKKHTRTRTHTLSHISLWCHNTFCQCWCCQCFLFVVVLSFYFFIFFLLSYFL